MNRLEIPIFECLLNGTVEVDSKGKVIFCGRELDLGNINTSVMLGHAIELLKNIKAKTGININDISCEIINASKKNKRKNKESMSMETFQQELEKFFDKIRKSCGIGSSD